MSETGTSVQEAVDEAVRHCAQLEGPLLPVLQAVQSALGHIPPEAVAQVAQALNLSRAEVHGVISFYHDLRTAPAGNSFM